MRKTVMFALGIVALLGGSPFASGAGERRVTVYDGLVSLEIPADWVEVPPMHLDEVTFRTAEATGGRLVEVYQHGFRPADPAGDHGLPQILVQIRESGRMRYGLLLDRRGLDGVRGDAGAAFPKAVPPLVVGLDVDRLAFDPARFALSMEHRLDLKFRGEVRVLTTAFLTERGLVAFHYSDRERRMEAGRALFARIMKSVVLDREIAYRPRLRDRWPGLPFFVAAAVLAAALATLLVLLRRRTR